jgi:hypothetical protein
MLEGSLGGKVKELDEVVKYLFVVSMMTGDGHQGLFDGSQIY